MVRQAFGTLWGFSSKWVTELHKFQDSWKEVEPPGRTLDSEQSLLCGRPHQEYPWYGLAPEAKLGHGIGLSVCLASAQQPSAQDKHMNWTLTFSTCCYLSQVLS